MFDQIAATVEAGGASALSFTALGTLILGYLANRWFINDHVAVKIFIYLTIFMGVAGVYYTQLVDDKDVEVVLERKKEEQAKEVAAEEAPETREGGERRDNAPNGGGIDQAPPAQSPKPSIEKVVMPLDQLTALSDKFYDDGEYARSFELNSEGCSRGAGVSCRWNGYLLESGKGFAVDLTKAKKWYERGCSLGNPESCERKAALQTE